MLLPQRPSPIMSTLEFFDSHRSSHGNNSCSTRHCARKLAALGFALFAGMLCVVHAARAALVDQWLAESLATLSDGDLVGSWTSVSNRTVTGSAGLQPVLKQNITPAGGPVVRFNRNFLTTGSSPIGGATAFSIAIVFKAAAAGANEASGNWYGMSGLVDAEQGGVTTDWGTVIENNGQVGMGSGSPDITTLSAGASLVDSNFH